MSGRNEALPETPGVGAAPTAPLINPPVGLLAELTHRCPLQCPYCSNPLALEGHARELPTEVWLDVFEQAAALGILHVHLSGGEPAARRDLEQLVAGAARSGLYSNLITSGVGLKRSRLEALSRAGLDHVQISIQHSSAAAADQIANREGAHARKLETARAVRDLGIALTLNAPVHRHNLDHLRDMIDLATKAGARRLEVAHVQYYGWALANRAALMPTREQVAASIEIVAAARERLRGVLEIDFVPPDYYASRPKPCMGGWGRGIINVTPSGKTLPCHAAESILDLEFENVRDRPLREIWETSAAFQKFRGTGWMREPCRSCEFREIDYGGCRCQAMALTGDARVADPVCVKSPHHRLITELVHDSSGRPGPAFQYRKLDRH